MNDDQPRRTGPAHARPALRWFGVLAALWMAGCGQSDEPIILQAIANQQAEVGSEMRVELVVLNSKGNAPRFSLLTEPVGSATALGDLTVRATKPARFDFFGDSGAYFRWQPLGADVGEHIFRIVAEVNGQADGQNFRVYVRPGSASPRFIKPQGNLTLNFAQDNCIAFDILVDDPDSSAVIISLEQPFEANYKLTPTGDKSAQFEWCPDANQLMSNRGFDVHLLADDGAGHQARKTVKIGLRQQLQEGCPGQSPTIEHMLPETALGLNELKISTTVADDIRLASVVLYYTFEAPPGEERDVSALKSIELESNLTGQNDTLADGIKYTGVIPISPPEGYPNPVLYYFIEATDDDDAQGNCDHRTAAPKQGFFELPVSPRTQLMPTEPCGECNSDEVCGGGLCVQQGPASFCLPRCDGSTEPAACQGVPSVGCCDGQFLVRCVDGRESREDCGSTEGCGWDDGAGAYSCRAVRMNDPLSRYPRACGTSEGTSEVCPTGFQCTTGTVMSVDNVSASAVCLPASGSCVPPCVDDPFEQGGNNSLAEVQNQGYITLGQSVQNLKLCTEGDAVNEDYYGMFVDQPGGLQIDVTFMHEQGDVDVELLDGAGTTMGRGYTTTDNESICADIAPGNYFVKVLSFESYIDNQYELLVTSLPTSCSGGPVNPAPNPMTNPMPTPNEMGGQPAVEGDQTGQPLGGMVDMSSIGGRAAPPPPPPPPSGMPAAPMAGMAAPNEPVQCENDELEANNSADMATVIDANFSETDLTICEGDDDWYRFELGAFSSIEIFVNFAHAAGDIDLLIYEEAFPGAPLRRVGDGLSVTDNERAKIDAGDQPMTLLIKVNAYNNAVNTYQMRVQVTVTI
ncbi:MAG: hypothetical protein VX589_13295 [Myxococcota bacterium]|nr:hypothetical protein [Myxococcota bacterium]